MAQGFVGSIKSFNPEKGWGHIECAETFQIYGKDIFLLRSQLGGANSIPQGAQVSFKIVDNGRGPEATDVTMISASTAGPGQSGGPSYVGVIKSFNPASGWGHITCAQTESIYGKDIFFMKSQLPGGTIAKGTSVHFCVGQGLKGPEANNIRPVMNGAMGPPQLGLGPGCANGSDSIDGIGGIDGTDGLGVQQIGNVFPAWGMSGVPSNSVFYGTVKSFNEEKGWGHITCMQTHAVYGKDMFVMRSALNGTSIKQGDSVQFNVVKGVKGPEASNVKVVGHSGTDVTYVGTIKQFTEEKGWGFIACNETHQLYGKDIFIHKNELGGYSPAAGESVQFSVQISPQGRPEATRMVFGAGRYNAVRKAPWGKGRAVPF